MIFYLNAFCWLSSLISLMRVWNNLFTKKNIFFSFPKCVVFKSGAGLFKTFKLTEVKTFGPFQSIKMLNEFQMFSSCFLSWLFCSPDLSMCSLLAPVFLNVTQSYFSRTWFKHLQKKWHRVHSALSFRKRGHVNGGGGGLHILFCMFSFSNACNSELHKFVT